MVDMNDPKIAEQMPINQAILWALIEVTPDDWQAAELHLKWNHDLTSVGHSVICPDTGSGGAPSQALLDATAQLTEHGRKFALPWVSAVFAVRRAAEGNWEAGATFQQAVPAPSTPPE